MAPMMKAIKLSALSNLYPSGLLRCLFYLAPNRSMTVIAGRRDDSASCNVPISITVTQAAIGRYPAARILVTGRRAAVRSALASGH